MDERKLLKVIQGAQASGTMELSLSGKGLTQLPPEIGRLINLAIFNLHDNQLTKLPPEIGRLTNLKYLSLNQNQLTSLPPEIGRLTNLKYLSLDHNQLTSLPPEIGRLTNLEALSIARNQMTSLPPEIGCLADLYALYLHDNQLISLPAEVGLLTNLTHLAIDNNKLTSLPPDIGRLVRLVALALPFNQLSKVPPEIGRLANLAKLWLHHNRLSSLPPEIGRLANLTKLWLHHNRLRRLPAEIGQLSKLEDLYCGDNPLESPPPEIVAQGTDAMLAYLRSQAEEGELQWRSKLVLVGEGRVGKTQVLRALLGLPFDASVPSTHGIEIKKLDIPHPMEPGVTMSLNCWDFGGQEIYHATHQFFLTNRSLFLLVWDAQREYSQCKVINWLETIKAMAPDSPVILVATNLDQGRPADLPLAEIRAKFDNVVAACAVSNMEPRTGFEELHKVLAETAADLPLMGETWPAAWVKAAEAVRGEDRKHVTERELLEVMKSTGLAEKDSEILAQWLHDLGDILYYPDEDELADTVILKPQWVSEYISKVLDSDEVQKRDGVLTKEHMADLWSNVDLHLRDRFLTLMEKFDLSYRTLENREISLVVERLSLDRPGDLEEKWAKAAEIEGCKEIALRFYLSVMPPGIPTWFIARSHRFTTRTHWRRGAIFADDREAPRHYALVQALSNPDRVELIVRGPSPHNFFALLKDGFEYVLGRFPGMRIDRKMPCPGHEGRACSHEFKYEQLVQRLERVPPKDEIECGEAMENVNVWQLLFGMHPMTQEQVLARLAELEELIKSGNKEILGQLHDLRALSQRHFTAWHRAEQSNVDTECPNVFTLKPAEATGWLTRAAGKYRKLINRDMELHLWCQAPGEWHPTGRDGTYRIKAAPGWLTAMAPYLSNLVAVLKYAAPFAAPWLGMTYPALEQCYKHEIKFMTELAKLLPDLDESQDGMMKYLSSIESAKEEWYDSIVGSPLRAVRHLLDEVDPTRQYGGLRKTLTPEGHWLWLCEHHAKEYAR